MILALILGAIGAALFYLGTKRIGKYRLIKDIPHSKIRSMAPGLVEVQGKITAENYLITPFSKQKCVYYRYEVKEYKRHTHTDSKGRKRTSHSWQTIDSGNQKIPFLIEDGTGKAKVEPEGAEFQVPVKKVFIQRRSFAQRMKDLVTLIKEGKTQELNLEEVDRKHIWRKKVGDRKCIEHFLEPQEQVYIIGRAEESIRKGEIFIISNKDELQIAKTLLWQAVGLITLALIIVLVALLAGL